MLAPGCLGRRIAGRGAGRSANSEEPDDRRAGDDVGEHGSLHGKPGGQASNTGTGAGESGLGHVSTVDDERDDRERSTGEAGHGDDHALLEAVLLGGDGPSDRTGS